MSTKDVARLRPSSAVDRAWLYVASPGLTAFQSDEHTGKWCVFRDFDAIDEAWDRVSACVTRGELLLAKVSTALSGRDTHVICVYTPDWSDEAELERTREVLRQAGFTEELGYKRDLETFKGVYGDSEWWVRK